MRCQLDVTLSGLLDRRFTHCLPILRRREFYPELAETLQKRRLTVDLRIPGFQQYDRIALAEAVLERDGQGVRPSTYLTFRDRYGEGGAGTAAWLTKSSGKHLDHVIG